MESQYPITTMLAAGFLLRANSLLSTNVDKSPGMRTVFILQYDNQTDVTINLSTMSTGRTGIESWWVVRFSAPVQTSPRAHPASYTTGTGSFPGVKCPGHGADHPPPPSAEVEGRVELYLYSPSGPSWPVLGRTLYNDYSLINCTTGAVALVTLSQWYINISY